MMQFPSLQRAFIQRHLPQELITLVDLNQLQGMPAKFAQANKTVVPDCVLRAPYTQGKGWLYVLSEQQTNPSSHVPLRLAVARGRVFEFDLYDQHSELPPIVWTLIFSNGRTRWRSCLDIFHKLPPAARKWAHHCLSNPPQLVQVLDMPLVTNSSCPELDAMQLLMQKAYDDPVQAFIDLSPLLQAVLQRDNGKAIFNEMFHYILTGDGHESASHVIMKLEAGLQGNVRRTVMTLAQMLKKEAEQIGMEKVATRMLRRGMQAKDVIDITHLPKKRIIELLAKLQHTATKSR